MKDKLMGMASLPMQGMATGLDFVKQVWSNVELPNGVGGPLAESLSKFIAPTLDIKEIDKRIADLQAVEKWLELNLNMLRTTVQALEVQRGTINQLARLGIGKDENGVTGSLKDLPKTAMDMGGKMISPQQWWAALSGPVAEMMGSAAKASVQSAIKASAPKRAAAPAPAAASPRKAPAKKLASKTVRKR